VFAAWKDAAARGECIKLTDPNMTRYFLPVPEAAEFLADNAPPGAVSFPPGLGAATMGDVAAAVAGHRVEVVGRRPGETRHQWLVAPGDRVRHIGATCVLGDGEAVPRGLSSETAPRWAVGELLAAAGVRPCVPS
jgi:FlaA1/EpsC-like NDP-sugar epimerase